MRAGAALTSLALVMGLAAAQAQLNPDSGSVPGVKGESMEFEPEVIAVPDLPAQEYAGLPQAESLGAMNFDDGTTIPFTQDDVLWAARMVHAETRGGAVGVDASAMLWSICQRSYWRGRKETFSELIPLYSQPINKAWLRDGSRCKDHPALGEVEKKGEYNPCAKHRLELREKYRTLEWGGISAVARKYAVLLVTGRLENPAPGAIGWLAKGVWKPGGGEGRKELLRLGSNVFYGSETPRKIGGKKRKTTDWTGSEVVVSAPGGRRSSVRAQ